MGVNAAFSQGCRRAVEIHAAAHNEHNHVTCPAAHRSAAKELLEPSTRAHTALLLTPVAPLPAAPPARNGTCGDGGSAPSDTLRASPFAGSSMPTVTSRIALRKHQHTPCEREGELRWRLWVRLDSPPA